MVLLLKIKLHFREAVKTFTQKTHNQVEYTNKIGSQPFLEIFSISHQECSTYITKQNQEKLLIKMVKYFIWFSIDKSITDLLMIQMFFSLAFRLESSISGDFTLRDVSVSINTKSITKA